MAVYRDPHESDGSIRGSRTSPGHFAAGEVAKGTTWEMWVQRWSAEEQPPDTQPRPRNSTHQVSQQSTRVHNQQWRERRTLTLTMCLLAVKEQSLGLKVIELEGASGGH